MADDAADEAAEVMADEAPDGSVWPDDEPPDDYLHPVATATSTANAATGVVILGTPPPYQTTVWPVGGPADGPLLMRPLSSDPNDGAAS